MPVEQKGDTFTIHFAALFSEKHNAIPIILSHGWPGTQPFRRLHCAHKAYFAIGSFIEFLSLMTLLKDRYAPSELPYHIIVPSLPGWGFSSPPPLKRDFALEDVAEIFNSLMVNLGFGEGYVSQGGDIGSDVARLLGVFHKECKAVHGKFVANYTCAVFGVSV